MDRQLGFSAILIKSVSEDKREITGIASTPQLDRVNDIVEPLGLTFEKNTPLLLGHDHAKPVGNVQFGTPTAAGLPFKATIAKVTEPGIVKDRTDESWHSVKAGLIRGVSIGFVPKASEPLGNGKGTRFTRAAVHELSLVAIPANPGAIITAFKSLADASNPRAILEPYLPEMQARREALIADARRQKLIDEANPERKVRLTTPLWTKHK